MKMETIGEKIFDIRRRKGYSQQELSDLAGINLMTLQRIGKVGNIIIPGIIWFLKRDKISRLNESGADLLNFQISWTILLVFSFLLSMLVYYEWGARSGTVYTPAVYIIIFLVLINILYPIIVGILVYKRMPYKYYYPLIKYIR
jgi:uncharacterized Tic20 family protein